MPGTNDGGDGGKGSLPLSVGAIIGIVVGVVGGLCLITALIVWLCVQYRRRKLLRDWLFCIFGAGLCVVFCFEKLAQIGRAHV